METLDTTVLLAINRGLAAPWLDGVMRALSSGAAGWGLALAVAIALGIRGGPRGRWVALGMVLAVAVSDPLAARVLKPLFGRLRPCHELVELVRLADGCGGRWSLPSNHAANLAALAAVLGAGYRRALWAAVPLVFAVGVSRIYLAAHYPSDVLAGWLIGAGIGLGVASGLAAVRRWLAARRGT